MTAPAPGGDRIVITGLRIRGHHGVLDFERLGGQWFVVDVEVVMPLGVAAASDDVTDTLHYGVLSGRIAEAVASDPVNLIETVAERIARIVLEDGRVEQVVVTVHKPEAPIEVPFADVAVRIVRSRQG